MSESTFGAHRKFDPQLDGRWRSFVVRARSEGPGIWIELLQDRALWREAPDWAQDQSIKVVAETLGPRFTNIGSQMFSCGDQTFRIASFRFTGAEAAPQPDLENQLNPEDAAAPKNALDWVFRLIPGGRFDLGSAESDRIAHSVEKPSRQINAPPFLIAACPTTQAMWQTIDGENPSRFIGEDRPVEGLSWERATEGLARLEAGLRLPSEVEWEYAARAGSQGNFCFGDDFDELEHYAWFVENSKDETHPVARLRPNAFGLFDVHGNVWEYCADSWFPDYALGPADHHPRDRGLFEGRVLRGGSWFEDPQDCRSAFRGSTTEGFGTIGFRIARSLSLT